MGFTVRHRDIMIPVLVSLPELGSGAVVGLMLRKGVVLVLTLTLVVVAGTNPVAIPGAAPGQAGTICRFRHVRI